MFLCYSIAIIETKLPNRWLKWIHSLRFRSWSFTYCCLCRKTSRICRNGHFVVFKNTNFPYFFIWLPVKKIWNMCNFSHFLSLSLSKHQKMHNMTLKWKKFDMYSFNMIFTYLHAVGSVLVRNKRSNGGQRIGQESMKGTMCVWSTNQAWGART